MVLTQICQAIKLLRCLKPVMRGLLPVCCNIWLLPWQPVHGLARPTRDPLKSKFVADKNTKICPGRWVRTFAVRSDSYKICICKANSCTV